MLLNNLGKFIAGLVLAGIKADASQVEAFLAPYITQGEDAFVAACTKLNPFLGMLVQTAIAALGAQVPALEGDAVTYLEALLTKYIAS